MIKETHRSINPFPVMEGNKVLQRGVLLRRGVRKDDDRVRFRLVLRPIAANAEIGGVPRRVKPLPDPVLIPALSDRVAQEEKVDVPLFRQDEEAVVNLHPGSFARLRHDCCRALSARGQRGGEERQRDRQGKRSLADAISGH